VSVTKKDLAENISKKLRLSRKDSLFFVNTFFGMIAAQSSSKVNINNFGTFSLKKTPSRIGRNPKTLEQFNIKKRIKLSFKPSEIIKKVIN